MSPGLVAPFPRSLGSTVVSSALLVAQFDVGRVCYVLSFGLVPLEPAYPTQRARHYDQAEVRVGGIPYMV